MRTSLLSLTLGAGLLAASGCAGVYSFNARPYHRPDTTADVRGEDYRECSEASVPKIEAGERTGRIVAGLFCPLCMAGSNADAADGIKQRREACMLAKGYTVGPRSAQP